MNQRATIKAIGIVIILTIITKLLGFGRELVLAYYYSASVVSDAYLLSSDIVSIPFGWIPSFAVVFTPIFSLILVKEGKDRALDYTRKVLIIVIVVSILSIALTEAIPSVIVNAIGHGLAKESQQYVVDYLRIIIFSVGFNALSELFISYLNVYESYTAANLVGLPFNIIEIVAIAISAYLHNPILMAFGVVGGNIVKCCTAYAFSIKKGFKYRNFHLSNDPFIRQTWVMFIPVYFSNMLVEINTLIDKSFASYLPEGSLTLLNYGAVTRRFIFNVFSIVISSIFFPLFSKLVAQKGNSETSNVIERTLNAAIAIFIPISFLAICFSNDFISFLYDRGALKGRSEDVSIIFALYCVGLTPMIVNEICSRIVYSFKNTKLPLYTGIITIAFNCLFNFIFIRLMGAPGLALATSLSQMIVTPLFLYLIHKKECPIKTGTLIVNLLQTICVSGVLYIIFIIIAKCSYVNAIRTQFGVAFAIVGSLIYIVVYVLSMFRFKNEAIIEMMSHIKLWRK